MIASSSLQFYIFNASGAVLGNHSMLMIISSSTNILLAWATPGYILVKNKIS